MQDPVFEEMSDTEFLEITNIVGIAAFGTITDYSDQLLYLAQSLYPGCILVSLILSHLKVLQKLTKNNGSRTK